MLEDSIRTRLLSRKLRKKTHIPDRRWNSKFVWRRPGFPKIHHQSERDEEFRGGLRGESDGSQPKDTKTDDSVARHDFLWTVRNYIYRHHVEPRVKLQVPSDYSQYHCDTSTRKPFLDRRKKTMPWRSADLDFALGAPRNQSSAFTLLPMKTVTLWKTKTNRAGGCANVGARFLRRTLKAKGTINMRTSCDTFRKLLMTYVGKLTETNLMNSWPQKGIRSRS